MRVRRLRGGLRPDGVALVGRSILGRVGAMAGRRIRAETPSWTVRLLWLGLAASASILLLAVTTHLTQDVAPIPFLWIVPLTVYLLTFIFCFEMPRFYRRPVFLPLFVASLGFMVFRLWSGHAG